MSDQTFIFFKKHFILKSYINESMFNEIIANKKI